MRGGVELAQRQVGAVMEKGPIYYEQYKDRGDEMSANPQQAECRTCNNTGYTTGTAGSNGISGLVPCSNPIHTAPIEAQEAKPVLDFYGQIGRPRPEATQGELQSLIASNEALQDLIVDHPELATLLETYLTTTATRMAVEARLDEIGRKLTLHVELMSSPDFKAGFSAALDQIDAADGIRKAELQAQLKGLEGKDE